MSTTYDQNIVNNDLERQTENTLEVGVNPRAGLLYVGIYMCSFVAANVSKETPYLSGW